MEIKGRTAIITGAGSGIGRAIALEFARNGANTVCCGRRKGRLDETVKMITNEGGVGLAVAADITKREDVQRMVGQVLENFGSIEVLFNNAGSFQSIAGVYEVDPELWWLDVRVNLLGSLLTMRAVLPHMIAKNEGVIINMNGGRPVGGTGYACGKAGLMELTRITSEELKMMDSSVIVLSAGPGLVKTEMTQLQVDTEAGLKWIPSTKKSFEAGRTNNPEDIAAATIKMLKVVTPESSGKHYGPDTDFSDF